jgi:SOS-response transcriptional repressor LexA
MTVYRCLSLVSCDPDVWVEVPGTVYRSPSVEERTVYEFIRDYTASNNGVSPSFREIGAAVGISYAKAQRLVCRLEEGGQIKRIPNRVRALACVEHSAPPVN